MSKYRLDTTCVQGGYRPGNGEPRQIPIVQSTTFRYETSEAMGRLFDLEDTGYFYTRLQNPTNDMVAAKIAEMEGGTGSHADIFRTGSQFLCRIQHLPGRRSYGLLVHDLRWNVQPVRRDNEEIGHRSDIRRP